MNNRRTVTIAMLMCAFLGVGLDGYAQMIDYDLLKKRSKNQIQLISRPSNIQANKRNSISKNAEQRIAPKKKVNTPILELVVSDELTKVPIEEVIKSEPKVKDRIERIYDLNQDGVLQQDEILDMFRDVVLSVNRKGSFVVGSELLEGFDVNRDGQISRTEAVLISEKTN